MSRQVAHLALPASVSASIFRESRSSFGRTQQGRSSTREPVLIIWAEQKPPLRKTFAKPADHTATIGNVVHEWTGSSLPQRRDHQRGPEFLAQSVAAATSGRLQRVPDPLAVGQDELKLPPAASRWAWSSMVSYVPQFLGPQGFCLEHLTLLRLHAAALIKVDMAATTAAVIRKSL